jgi:hypothetical protein
MLVEQAAAEKSRELKQLLEDRENYRRKIEVEEAEEKRQFAAAINAERTSREAELLVQEKAYRERIDEEEAEEKRLGAAAVTAERMQREAAQMILEKAQMENSAVLNEIIAEKARKADAQRLKREAFLNDTNAFSETIEQEAARASRERQLSANGAVCEQYKTQSVRFSDATSQHSYQPLAPPNNTGEICGSSDSDEDSRSSDADTSHSFKELTSSLFAANTANTERHSDRGNRSDIWGDRRDYPNVNSAANVTAQRAESYRREHDHDYSANERHGTSAPMMSQADDEEEEEGMGGATSISNILTIDERRELSVEQKVAWRALQADLTTRRKGRYSAISWLHFMFPV